MAIPIKAALTLSSKAFNLGMKGASKAVGGLVFAFKALALAIPVATGLFTALIARQTQIIDRIGKVSTTTGVATSTLQKFGFAAEIAGVSTDQAQVALRRFSRRLGEAQKGTGELLPALKKLGIETRKNDGTFKSAEEVLLEFADGIANTEGASAKLALAFKAFDSEGAELVGVLNEGSAAMLEMFGKAEALGAVLSRSAIQGVEDFNDSFTELQTLLNGVANQLTAALAPALKLVTDELIDFIMKGSKEFGSFESLAEVMAVGIVDAVELIVTAFMNLTQSVVDFVNDFRFYAKSLGFRDLTAEAQLFQDVLDTTNEELTKIGGGKPLDRLISKTGLASAAFEILERAMASGSSVGMGMIAEDIIRFVENFEKINKAVNEVQASGEKNAFRQNVALKEANKLVQENLDIVRDALASQVYANDQITFSKDTYNVILGILKKMRDAIIKKNEDTDDGNEDLEKELSLYEKILNKLNQINGEKIVDDNFVERLKARLDPVERLAKTLEDGLVGAVNKFEDALAQGLIDGKADFAAFGDFIKQTLAKAFVQRFVTGPILAAFGLASGGPAKAGQPYIVGEEGPELFIPKNSGTVIPNDETMSIMGARGQGMNGGSTTVNYNIQAVDAPSFQQLVARDPEFIFNVSRAGARRTPGG